MLRNPDSILLAKALLESRLPPRREMGMPDLTANLLLIDSLPYWISRNDELVFFMAVNNDAATAVLMPAFLRDKLLVIRRRHQRVEFVRIL